MCWFYTHILAPVCRYIAGALIKIYFRQMRVKILDNIDKEVLSQRFETICVGTWQTGFIIFFVDVLLVGELFGLSQTGTLFV